MDLNKSRDFFDPRKVKGRCHVIGCGSIGSNVAEALARYGIEDIVLWDYDVVESHNIANQLFTEVNIGEEKTLALARILTHINPKLKHTLQIKGKYTDEILTDYVFMCVDSVEVRKDIVQQNKMNPLVKAVFDFRTTLLEGQCYFADWKKKKDKESLIESLNFTHEEAMTNTPVSACGFTLSVTPVVRITALMGIANFTNLINKEETKHLIVVNPYSFSFFAVYLHYYKDTSSLKTYN